MEKHKSSTREKKEANVEEEAECAKNFLFLAKKKDTFCLKKKLRTCASLYYVETHKPGNFLLSISSFVKKQ